MSWSDVKDQVLELVNRSSFNRLELAFSVSTDYEDLMLNIESDTNLRNKLKKLEHRYQNYPNRRGQYELVWWFRHRFATNDSLFFPRFMSAVQDVGSFNLDVTSLRYRRPRGSSLLSNLEWNPSNLKRLYFISHFSQFYESGLFFIISKCSKNLKHLKVITQSNIVINCSHPIGNILAICPKLLTFESDELGNCYSLIAIGDKLVRDTSRGSSSKRYSLRFIKGRFYDPDKTTSWLKKHCPRLTISQR